MFSLDLRQVGASVSRVPHLLLSLAIEDWGAFAA